MRAGERVDLGDLEQDPHPHLARLREEEPVAWVPVLDGWLVTRRDLCSEVMRDPLTFTVDDPRFSTARVVGPSMLSLDGTEHARHRDPFAAAFRSTEVRRQFVGVVSEIVNDLIDGLDASGAAELRRQLAGPLAVQVMTEALSLVDTDCIALLGWYDAIVAAVDRISAGEDAGSEGGAAFDDLARRVADTVASGRGLLAEAASSLSVDEVASNAAVMLFGGIETAEGMTVNTFWHLLTHPRQLAEVKEDRQLVPAAVEESLRLEPAAGRVDRYATRSVELGGARIMEGDLVIVSISAANRDPDTFPHPDTFDLHRKNVRSHLAFAQGPHACVGLHLARLETATAIEVALRRLPDLELDRDLSDPPRGLVFRKVPRLGVTWVEKLERK